MNKFIQTKFLISLEETEELKGNESKMVQDKEKRETFIK